MISLCFDVEAWLRVNEMIIRMDAIVTPNGEKKDEAKYTVDSANFDMVANFG
ncbi:hypothetical protein ACLOJK_035427 [Asimina triloba]